MSIEKDVLGIVPGLQATALLGNNLKLLKVKKITPKKIVKTGATNLLGISLIGASAGMINKL